MERSNYYAFIVCIILLTIHANLFGQQPNAYKFIEPNISVSYDSNHFKIGNNYSNETYGESYDFSYVGNNSKKTMIHISADHPVTNLSKKEGDSLMAAGIKEIKLLENDTVGIVNIDEHVRDVRGFSCVGFVGYDKVDKRYATVITCHHLSYNDATQIDYFSSGGRDLDSEYQILTTFLSGFKSYSIQQIKTEDSIIKNKYTVVVQPSKIVDDFRGMPSTYRGVVFVAQKLEHKISEVRIAFDNSGSSFSVFFPNDRGQVPIYLNDENKGTVTKKGEFVLLNSFGKKVKLPFTFTYQNNGPL